MSRNASPKKNLLGERCVTSRTTAAKETKSDTIYTNITSVPDFWFCEICTSQPSSLFSLTVSRFLLSSCQAFVYIACLVVLLLCVGSFTSQRTHRAHWRILSSLSKETRKSYHFQMSLQRQHFLLNYFETLSVGTAGVIWTRDLPHRNPILNQLSRPVGIHLFICFVAGRCVCTPGLSYIRINNYQPRNDRTRDDVRFEFKSTQSSGMIMFLKGRYRDSLYVAYEDSRVFIVRIDLGTGNTASRTKGLPGVLGNKGTLAKYRKIGRASCRERV